MDIAAIPVYRRFLRYGVPVASVLITTLLFEFFSRQINSTTVALTFILFVLLSASFFGRNPALVAAFVAMLCFNFFFLPPMRTWHIADSQNLVAWAAFTITAIIAGELSAYARRRAQEAERQRVEIEDLYTELRDAFEKASQAEALKQSEQLKSSLLDAVTHDLRTPLTSIKASVTTLLDSEGGHRTIELDGETRVEFLEIINEETDRLNSFIEGMVGLARVEAGSAALREASSSVGEIVSIATHRAASLLAGHRLSLELANDLPEIRVDAAAIAEVIYTLLDNAAKYSPAQSAITIGAAPLDGEVEIWVGDEGKGIDPAMREKVFEKFFRLEKRSSSGIGLGLAIARGIIESHGGGIRIEDGAGGKGTRVVFTVPVGGSK